MQEGTYSFLFKLIIGISIWATTNIYFGAFAIAFISAFTRVVYEAECKTDHFTCFKKLIRYFILSLGLAMLFVHIGFMYTWSKDTTIVISSVFAFMSEETFKFILKNWESLLIKVGSRVSK